MMTLHPIPPSTAQKSKYASIRLSTQQATALKQHCVRTGQTAQDALIAILAAAVPNFHE